jgi:hypothetical protein
MTPTHVELYEALKPSIGEAAARMIAEVVPPTGDLATKGDLAAMSADIAAGFADVAAGFARVDVEFGRVWEEFAKVRGEIHAESARSLRWMIALFVPVWAGTWATVIAVVLKS